MKNRRNQAYLDLAAIALLALGAGSFEQARAQAPAQATVPATPGIPMAAADDSHTISLDVQVNDKLGHHVAGLTQGDFTLLDNKQPAKILSVHEVDTRTAATDPIRVVIVIDTINTSFDVIAREREQLGEYLKQDGGKLAHPTSLVIFTEKGIQLEKASIRDGNALAAALNGANSELRIEGRGAGFWGASDMVQWSLQQLTELVSYEATQPGRKLVFFLSPGWPLLPYAGIEETEKQRQWTFHAVVGLTNALRQTQTTLYSLTPYTLGRSDPFYYKGYLKPVSNADHAEYPDLALQVLATHSGGLVQTTGMDVLGEINTAERDANSYYTVTFETAPGDRQNEYHALDLRTDKPDAAVRTSSGYYANAPH
jgi:VWFA-related protein